MPLQKVEDFDPGYRETIQGNDIKGMGVYTEGSNEKIGTVSDVMVDEQGQFRYFVVDVGFWVFGKKVLLPVGRTRIDFNADRVYALGMTKEQAEALPAYDERNVVDYEHEEQVRGVYRNQATASAASAPTYNRDTYTYQQDASLYDMNEQDHQTLRLYEERLIANKNRVKTGEVAIGKRVETETTRVSVPVEKERVVVERVTPPDAGRPVAPGEATFREGEVAHMDVYEETPDIRKEAFVREEVRVKKVVDHETVEAQETIRREELDIDNQGSAIADKSERI